MASRSSSSTRSPATSLTKPSERSRAELSSQGSRASASPEPQQRSNRSPKDKKHKSLAEVQGTGRQSDQGGSPGAREGRSSSRGTR